MNISNLLTNEIEYKALMTMDLQIAGLIIAAILGILAIIAVSIHIYKQVKK